MSLKFFVMALLLCTMLLAVAACNNATASLGKEFSVRIGESVTIKGEQLTVRFLEVTEDSRCPSGVVCVWEGRVSVLVELTYKGSSNNLILTEPGRTCFPADESFKEYQISYHIEPYPQAGAEIPEDEYRLLLKINK